MEAPRTEHDLIQYISIIASNHHCELIMIDYKNEIINLEGPEDQQVKCAIAIEDQLGKYMINPPEHKKHITTLHGWRL